MKSSEEIKDLAYLRLSEAEILCEAQKYDGAFYLAGYSVELMLKAKICEHWGIPNLFAETNDALVTFNLGNSCTITDSVLKSNLSKVATTALRKAVKTHNITQLFIFSGLKDKFRVAKSSSIKFMLADALLFESSGRCQWSEQVRYQFNTQDAFTVQNLLNVLQDDNNERGLLQWIAQA